MKNLFTILLLLIGFLTHSQITDDPNKSTRIPVVESEKSVDIDLKGEDKTLEQEELSLNVKRYTDSFDLTERKSKGFTMVQNNDLVNPGVIFEEKWRKKKPVEELGMQYEKDIYFGEYKLRSEFVKIIFRDFGEEDGDIIRVFANEDVIIPRAIMKNVFQSYKLTLVDGFNKIDFMALNQGLVGPNTAQFLVIDDKENVIYDNAWNLATGGKASIVFVKE